MNPHAQDIAGLVAGAAVLGGLLAILALAGGSRWAMRSRCARCTAGGRLATCSAPGLFEGHSLCRPCSLLAQLEARVSP